MSTSNQSNQPNNNNQQPPNQPNQTQQQQQAFYQNPEIEALIESSWISIKDRETTVLEFLTGPGKIRVLDKLDFSGKPTKRVQFTVIDINDLQRKEKTLELSKIHVGKIYEELQKGKTILEISRSGAAKDTRYFVKAVR